MSIHIKNNIHWVGKIDWELRKFHGDEYSTHRGSSYNSYNLPLDIICTSHGIIWRDKPQQIVEQYLQWIEF